MKRSFVYLLTTFLFLPIAIWAAEEDETPGARAALESFSATNQRAALTLNVKIGGGELTGLGAFISGDGLALVTLGSIALKEMPVVYTADGTQLAFGTVLGIFPEKELALVKFEHRPKVWLRLAPKEPVIGDLIALIALNPPDLLASDVPPVIGPVMAKRSAITPNLREGRFTKVLSLGAGLSPNQSGSIGAGSFAINIQGDLVAFKFGIGMAGSQRLILLTSVFDLVKEVEDLAQEGQGIPFPLPEAVNPMDLALLSSEYREMDLAIQRGDWMTARGPLKTMLDRYPHSHRINHWARNGMIMRSGPSLLDRDKLLKIEPDWPVAERVSSLYDRAAMAGVEGDFELVIRELKAALALSPPDYRAILNDLAGAHMMLRRFDEAEKFARKAHSITPESIEMIKILEYLLKQKGEDAEALKLQERASELERIYRNR